MKRAALYVRVSTEEQKKYGYSVDSQITALNEYCKKNGYENIGIYNDAGISARKPYSKRPELLRLLDDCKKHKIDVILFTKLDRWFRNVAGYYEVQSQLDEAGVTWRSIWEDYETETSSGVLKVNIMLSVAQAEADRTSERIKSVNDYRKSLGFRVAGRAPLGYSVENGILVKTNNEAIIKMFECYMKYRSTKKCRDLLSEYGYQYDRRNVSRMLSNPTYYGDAHGIKCEPYITKEQFDIIQAYKTTHRSREQKEKYEYIFSGILKCAECGKNLSGKTKPADDKYRYTYYVCNTHKDKECNNNKYIRETVIENYLLENIEAALKDYRVSIATTKKEVVNAKKRIEYLKGKKERLNELYIENNITKKTYDEKVKAIHKEIDELSSAKEYTLPVFPDNFKEIYNQLDKAHKRSFWLQTVKEIRIDKDKNIKIIF